MPRERYVFETATDGGEAGRAELPLESKVEGLPDKSWAAVRDSLRAGIVGVDMQTETPFGRRFVVYADYTASGRPHHEIERQLLQHVLPLYGNVHSITTATARQSTFFRNEARQLVKQYFGLGAEDAVIFCGSGTTAAVHKFVQILERANWDLGPLRDPKASCSSDAIAVRVEDRWGSIECKLCGVRVKSEAAYRAHCATAAHRAKLAAGQEVQANGASGGCAGTRRVVVLLDPTAHHSLSLPFREAAAAHSSSVSEEVEGGGDTSRAADAAAGPASSVPSRAAAQKSVVTCLDLSMADDAGGVDINDLKEKLQAVTASGASALCLLTAASNVTGFMADIPGVTEIIHSFGGLACWDLAGLAGHRRPDLAPADRPAAHVDVAFASPHKFIGGPSTCGLLLARKELLRNEVPAVPGGGAVFFVGPTWHSYISNSEEREEAGSPDLAACARTGLCLHLHASLPRGMIEDTEAKHLHKLLSTLLAQPRVEVLAPGATALGVGIVSFVIRYATGGLFLHHGFVSCLLNDLFGVQSRSGCVCAGPYAQHLLGMSTEVVAEYDRALSEGGCEVLRPGFTRVGVHFADSEADAEVVCGAIAWVAQHGWQLLPYYTFDVQTGEWTHRKDTRQAHRKWLSEWQPGGSSETKKLGAERGLLRPPPKTLAELRALADEAVVQLKSDRALLAGNVGVPLLPCAPQLLWFALPQDAVWTLRHHQAGEPAVDPGAHPCQGSAAEGDSKQPTCTLAGPTRPTRPVFFPRRSHVAAQPLPLHEPAGGAGHEDPACPSSSSTATPAASRREKPPKQLVRKVQEALADFDMINEGDRVLIGLSGGKDSLTLLHCLLEIQRTAPVRFEVGAATVDPQAAGYDPSALESYMSSLGVEYFMLGQPLMERAKERMDPKTASICSWCSRMKRGTLYKCMADNKYNVLALGQHLDDIAESFFMSAIFNGLLRTMKANYWGEGAGVEVRVIRPLVYVREAATEEFARTVQLPVITENCPACFEAPKERHKTKLLLSALEFEHQELFPRLLSTVRPLLDLPNIHNPFESGSQLWSHSKPVDGDNLWQKADSDRLETSPTAAAPKRWKTSNVIGHDGLLLLVGALGGCALSTLLIMGISRRSPCSARV